MSQPIFRTHPITGRPVLYCNPGYAMRIDGHGRGRRAARCWNSCSATRSRTNTSTPTHWAEGDVLMWDNIGTVHNAIADYRADEPRYMRRVQVMATKDYARLAA